jgi:Tannase and feruloyl esterase
MSVCGGRRALVALLAILAATCGDSSSSSPPPRAALPTATQTSSASRSPTLAHTAPPGITPTPRATSSSTPTASPEPSRTATASPSPLRTPLACADLAGAPIGGATIRSAEMVAAAGDNPDLCRVSGTIETALNFELRLPRGWTQKVLFIGGGGYDGVIPVPDIDILRKGYATIATDSGHTGSVLDAAWALDDPEAVQNFADRAWHTVLVAAREIITAHYAAPIRRTYFQGGSSGGREALIMAQRWPDDCDGVIARAPALNFVAVQLSANRLAKHVYATPGGYLPAATTEALGRAVLTACDELDGLADGMVSDVEGCRFDAGVLRCTGPPSDQCLTAAQLETVRAAHSAFPLPVSLANGVTEYPRYPVGGEESSTGWPLWITGFSPNPPSSFLFILSDGFIRFFVTGNPDFDSLAFAPEDYASTLSSLSTLLDATDPDLSRFAARGGKVILWHGWSDYALSAYSTVAYYERVVSAAGGRSAADEFVRFYASPGVDHLNNGAGAPIFDLLGALDAWVEDGAAPDDLVAYKVLPGSDTPVPFRPLCRYPTYARYSGSGDPNRATSFTCAPRALRQ